MEIEASPRSFTCVFIFFLILQFGHREADGANSKKTLMAIHLANKEGPYIGLIIPNQFEMNPLLNSSHFLPSSTIDSAGRRFRIGTIEGKKVIIVMTGLGMINAGITTQLLLSLFNVEGVLHYGIAGNANPSLHIGDVTIPKYWAHTGLWNWQRYGDGPEDELSLEENGDYTREVGYLKFANYNAGINKNGGITKNLSSSTNNLLNNVWYQRDEVFPVDGVPEERQHVFWLHVDSHYFNLSKALLGVELESCINATTCLSEKPKVKMVGRGVSADVFVDNAAYRTFLRDKFSASPVDMETAGVALICHQQRTPFIAFRSLSDLAGGDEASANEAAMFSALAVANSIKVLIQFIRSL